MEGIMKIRIISLTAFIIFLFACNNAAEDVRTPPIGDTADILTNWAKDFGNSQEELIHHSIVDDDGSLYITGVFRGTVNFNPAGNEERTALGGDIFVAKYNSTGIFQWVNTYSSPGFDRGVNLATDATGIYLLGQMTGSVSFDTNATLDSGANVNRGLFLLKLNKQGTYQWVQPLAYSSNGNGTLNYHYIGTFMRLGQNAIYITGSFEEQINFNPQGNADLRRSAGSKDIFQMKLNTTGSLQWVHTIGSAGYDMGHGVVIKADGGPIFVGHIDGTVDLNPHVDVVDEYTSLANPRNTEYSTDIFITRYDANGTYIGSQVIGGEQDDWIYGVESDTAGNLYLAGIFQGSADFDPSNEVFRLTAGAAGDGYDIFLSKFNSTGVHQWTRSFGGVNYHYDFGLNLHVNNNNNIYLARCYLDRSLLNPDNSQQHWASQGDADIFMSKFLANGSFQWSKIMGGAGWDCATSLTSNGGAIYMAGKYSSQMNIPDLTATFSANSSMAVSTDVFVIRLDEQ